MKEVQRITITLPKSLYQKIKEQAERDTRTIGEEITYLLKLHVPGYTDTIAIEAKEEDEWAKWR